MTNLAPVVDGLWAFTRPVWFSGVRQRARTTVVRLGDGGLLLHSPAPPTEQLAAQLAALGPVRWLLVPNGWHHLGAPSAAARFPEAKLVAPKSATARNPSLKIDFELDDPRFAALVPDLEALPLRGVPFWDETVFYHRATRTLLAADIVVCASHHDHWTIRWASRLFGFYERARVPPDAKTKLVDKAATAASLRAILERPAERLVVGHADIFEEGWRDHLANAWRLEGVEI